MRPVSEDIQQLTLKSLRSTLSKLSKAEVGMTEKGSNTTLVRKRREAVRIGLESLLGIWANGAFDYEADLIRDARATLLSAIPSLESQIAKAKPGSPQKTVNERRITAFRVALDSLEDRLAETD